MGKTDIVTVLSVSIHEGCSLRCSNCPGVSAWVQCHHKGPYKREGQSQRRHGDGSRGESDMKMVSGWL